MLPGFVAAICGRQDESQRVVCLGTIRVCLNDSAEVLFGSKLSARPKNFGHPQTSIDKVRPTIYEGGDRGLGPSRIPLMEPIERRRELGSVAAIFEVTNNLR